MNYDVMIIGAGAAGLFCAMEAGRRGRSVVLLDHAKRAGGKIPISGGGHCNFTNTGVGPIHYVCKNPHFTKSALSRYPAESFISLVRDHGLKFCERKHGELFLEGSAQDLVDVLKRECDCASARFELGCQIQKVYPLASEDVASQKRWRVQTSSGVFLSESLVVATGGLSIPKGGATGFGYELARQFGLKMVDTAPALDGLTFLGADLVLCRSLAGIALECAVTCGSMTFQENLLFTHNGLSGPAALQASLYWKPGESLFVDLLPNQDAFAWFLQKKKGGNRSVVKNLLCELLPSRLAEQLCARYFPSPLPLPQVSEKALEAFCQRLHAWELKPSGTVGYDKAEVTRGGVDTDELSSKTMEVKKMPGLYFIGEVVDVTGRLGGYNLHWAWASGWAAGQVV